MAYKKLYESIYGIDLLYFAGVSIEEVEKKAKRVFKIKGGLSSEPTDGAAFFVCYTNQEKIIYVIWIRNSKDIPATVHECVHLVTDIFKRRGIQISYQNDEQFAYYISWWIEKILEKRKRKKELNNG